MSARFRPAPVIAAAAAVAMMLPVTAEAGFSSTLVPVTGPLTGGNSDLTGIAIDPTGEALVAWTEGSTNEVAARVRRIRPDGSLGPVIDITDGTTRALGPQVAFAPNGSAIVAWIESAKLGAPQSVRARWIEPDGTLTEPFTVRAGSSTSEPGEMDLATTSGSGAIVAWHNFNSKPLFRIVEAEYVAPGGDVGELILPTSGAGSTHVQVAANSSGGSLLTWRDSSVEAQAVSPIGELGTLQTPAPGLIADPELATDGHDHFQLAYKRGSLPSSLEYRALAADATFGPEQTLDPMTEEQIGGFEIATNAGDRSIAAWNRYGESQTVRARFIAADGTPEATTFSTPAGTGNGATPSVGIGGLGGAAIAWDMGPGRDVWGRLLPPGGAPTGPVLLSSGSGEASVPQVEVAANEVGLVAWDERLEPESPESRFRVFARQVLPPPSCPDFDGAIVQGRPTRIDLHCSGPQLGAPAIVAQPSHGRLSDLDAAGQSVLYTPTPGYEGSDSFRFAGVNPGGTGSTQTARLEVGRDTVRPRVKRFSISRRRVSAGPAASTKRGKTVFKLRYSEIATATITVERRRRCPKARSSKRSCRRYGKVGTLRAREAATSAKVPLRRRVGGRRLSPGRYRATAIATDLAGNRSQPRRLGFTVVAG
ncbi:MAG TPA: Ig-like domain-containing protein [Solirubrobacterales bacterium]